MRRPPAGCRWWFELAAPWRTGWRGFPEKFPDFATCRVVLKLRRGPVAQGTEQALRKPVIEQISTFKPGIQVRLRRAKSARPHRVGLRSAWSSWATVLARRRKLIE